MNQQHPENKADSLAQAQEIIAHQAKEIETLRQQLEREQFAQELAGLLTSAKAINVILSPFTHSYLLELVVSTATQVISARSGSLFLIDEKAKDLVFEVAIGPAAQQVKKLRVPLGHGIAGMVAMTGQPMAIADTQQDGRYASNIATSINYIPKNIICVPLFYDDRIIGALELLDKIGAPSFSPAEMAALSLFSNIAAVAITQSRAYHDQQTLLTSLLHTFGVANAKHEQDLHRQAINFSNWQTENPTNTTAYELALLVHQLIQLGELESEMCKDILQSFVTTIHRRRELSGMMVG